MGMNAYWEAFRYPLRRGNLGILILGLFVLSFIPTLLSFVPIGGTVLGTVTELFLLGYYAVFLQSIVHASMRGMDRIPAWPEVEHPVDLAEDFLAVAAPFLLSFLPSILLRASMEGYELLRTTGFVLRSSMPACLLDGSPWRIGIETGLLVAGWIYLPMAVLVQSFYGGAAMLNPIAVLRAAWQTGPSYLLVTFLVWVLVTAAWAVRLIPGKFITTFGSSLLIFYALIVAARLMGTHYRRYRDKLGWERAELPDPA